MLRQTIPYALEDDLLDDVNDLHFALGDVHEQQVDVAWVKKQQLDQWLQALQQESLQVYQVLPELLLLPYQENSWTLIIDDDRWLLKNGGCEGFSLEAANAALTLQLMLDETDQLPESVNLYAGDNDRDAMLNQLPELLRGIVQWCDQDYWQLLCSVYNDQGSAGAVPLNMLQGDYEPKLPWRQWWQTWRVAAVLLVAATVMQFVAGYSELKSLQNTNLGLRQDIEKTYRSVVPRGPLVNPEKSLRRKVKALEGGSGGGFVMLLDKVAQVVAGTEGLTIQSLNYTEKQSEIRLNLIAPAFDDVETARANMEKAGLTAELVGSSSEKGKTRARLRIKG